MTFDPILWKIHQIYMIHYTLWFSRFFVGWFVELTFAEVCLDSERFVERILRIFVVWGKMFEENM